MASKIIEGLQEACAHAVISNRLSGNLEERTKAARDIISALYAAGLRFSMPKMEKDEARKIGGHARAAHLGPERRSQIAKKAADTRWNNN